MCPSNIIGIRNNNVIVPYSAATKRTKEVTLTFSSTPTGWSVAAAKGIAYSDSTGKWWLSFTIDATFTGATTVNTTIVGISVSPTNQPVSVVVTGGASNYGYVASTGQLAVTAVSSITNYVVNGNIALASEPTWADANMEGVLAADVYIAPASASAAGLLSYYEEGSTLLTASGFTTTVTGTAYWVKINNVVHMVIPSFGGTSNSTSFSLSGLPSKLHPVRNQDFVFHYAFDNGVAAYNVIARKNNGDGITLYKAAFDGWTNSGSKSIPGLNMSYILT